ncbi:MAG: AMP-binding protein, partial [Pirellulaceae bacterium]|nr:AMP-binding protein [Pirellulaceae bacterium]
KPTIICGTPTFIGYLLDRAQPDDLASIRLVIIGAERCPASLFDRFAAVAPSASVLEGYGITECSPLISSNLLDQTRAGSVGKPLPGVEVIVVDSETFDLRSPGEMGMLLVSGPNVFPGYIGHDGPDPFCNHDGKRWYITGDLGRVDEDGFIFFCGRLKRFLKAGGEMISLPALEEPFVQRFGPTEVGPRVAVEGVETDGGRWITLFTTEDIALNEANAILFEKGFRGVLRFDEVRHVDQIPVLGTGKTDYKALRGWIT